MKLTVTSFGKTPAGEETKRYTFTNARGSSVSISDFGGVLISLIVPDKHGKLGDVLLGYDSAAGYFPNEGYLGALIGRFANRICHGECELNGQTLRLAQNDHGHHLHGGDVGFDRKIWQAEANAEAGTLTLTYVSPDGEEHYPGTLTVVVRYTFSEDDKLTLHYEAVCDKDTIINLTNHAYFNLEGEGSGKVLDHTVQINADRFTVTDKDSIPTGELRDVQGTPFDLRAPKRIGDGLKEEFTCEQMRFATGYDHNFCLYGAGLREIAVVSAPISGRVMRVYTDLPGVQFYGGNYLQGVNDAKCGRKYTPREGFCLETQVYPDAANHAGFPTCVLKAGERFCSTTIYAFGA